VTAAWKTLSKTPFEIKSRLFAGTVDGESASKILRLQSTAAVATRQIELDVCSGQTKVPTKRREKHDGEARHAKDLPTREQTTMKGKGEGEWHLHWKVVLGFNTHERRPC